MFRSIRSRITLGYVAVWAAIMLSSAIGVYLYVAHQVREQQDRGLASCVKVIEQSLKHEVQEHRHAAEGEVEFATLLSTLHHQSFPREAVSVFMDSRRVAGKTGDSEISIGTPIQVDATRRVRFARQVLRGIPARVAASSLFVGNLRYTVMAAEPETDIELALTSLRSALILLAVLALLLSMFGGYFLARQALRPVVEMAKNVEQIQVTNLGDEIELQNPADELGYLGATFNRLLARMNTAFEQQRKFMADASHELRTPLSVSLLAAQIALDRPRSAQEYRNSLNTIRGQLERLSRLVGDMLALARSDSGGFVLRKRRCDVGELVLDSVRVARVLAREKEIRLEAGDLPEAPAHADPELIHRLIVILLDNAIRYSPPATTVRVSLSVCGGHYELDVRDEGQGIAPEARDRIFDRFYRVEESRSRTEADGAGLGLPIARWIAQVHDGTVELAESGPHGSTFRARLPAELFVAEAIASDQSEDSAINVH